MATVNLEITDQMREDQLVTALEGGSNYWYLIDEDAVKVINPYIKDEKGEQLPLAIAMFKAIKDGKSIPISDLEAEEDATEEDRILGHINYESILKGEQKMAEQYKEHFMNMYNEEGDAETADVWFQLAVMGSLTFG